MKILLLVLLLQSACNLYKYQNDVAKYKALDSVGFENADSIGPISTDPQAIAIGYDEHNEIQTGNTTPVELVSFAKTLIGTPYLYGSTNPNNGFDCSGFITYVFGHFNIAVPRSSVGFTNVGQEVSLQQAKPGDLILFTGTDSSIRIVGHMGIITENNKGDIQFIHSTSGRKYGVTSTPLEKYYMGRFVKVIRVFKEKNL